MKMSDCIFCNIEEKRIFLKSNFFIVIKDKFPVTKDHLLLIPKRHIESIFDLNKEEKNEFFEVLSVLKKKLLKKDKLILAFNIGVNDGLEAGQTIMHSHIHLIPRRKNDVQNPRGGVRGVIKDKQNYEAL